MNDGNPASDAGLKSDVDPFPGGGRKYFFPVNDQTPVITIERA